MIYFQLFYEFFIIGLFTFGGGYAMIPLVEETVIKNNWLTPEEFVNFIGVCESTPGPIAVNMATYVGAHEAGLLGSICATIGVVLPSFIIILIISMFVSNFIKNKYVKNFMKGVKPVIVSLIIGTGLILLLGLIGVNLKEFTFNIDIVSIIIFILITSIYIVYKKIFKKKLSSIYIILISAFLGIILSYIFI